MNKNDRLDIKKLNELRKQMIYEDKHDNDIQAAPRFWVVIDYSQVPTWEGIAEDIVIYIPEYNDSYEIDELIDIELEDGELPQGAIDDIDEINCEYSALDWIQTWIDEDAYLVPVSEMGSIVPDTLFLTKQDAREHIRKNKHHYSDKAHTFAMTAWRSESFRIIWDVLVNSDWKIGKFEEGVYE